MRERGGVRVKFWPPASLGTTENAPTLTLPRREREQLNDPEMRQAAIVLGVVLW